MNEVLESIEKIKWTQARRKILLGIVRNELAKPECKTIALELLNENKLYRERTLEQQVIHRENSKEQQEQHRNNSK